MLVQLCQNFIHSHTVISLKEFEHFRHAHSLVCRVGRDLVKEDVMYVDEELAFEFKFFAVFKVVVFELFFLVCFSRATNLRVAVFDQILLLFFFSHIMIQQK